MARPIPSLLSRSLLALALIAPLTRAAPPPAPSASVAPSAPVASSAAIASAPPEPLVAEPIAAPPKPACSPEQQRQVKQRRRSVVQVQSGGVHMQVFDPVAGVVFPTPRHVVTHRSALGVGRPISVTTLDGESIGAHAIGSLPGTDLVLLELEHDTTWPVIELAPDEPSDGQMVVAMGLNPDWRLTVRTGDVVRHNEQLVVLDSTPAMRDGAPLFDCEGRLLGLGSTEHAYTPAERIRELVAQPHPVVVPPLSFLHATFLMAIHVGEARTWVGATIGGAVSHRDELDLRLTLGLLTQLPTRQEEIAGQKAHGLRLQLEPTVGYRVLLVREAVPLYLIPTVGMVATWDWVSDHSRQDGIRPSFGARVQMFPLLSVGYAVQPSDLRFRDVTHQITFGLDF